MFILLVMCLFMQNACFANNGVSFIYINGSDSNSEKDRVWFEKGVGKFHPLLVDKIEKNKKTIGAQFNDYKYKINPKPTIFFWGDESKDDIAFMRAQLDLTKSPGAPAAFFARSMISAYLHDAIWVSKPPHMAPVLEQLNTLVKEEHNKGNKVVLFGYSAGTFVTYEYAFSRIRYIDLKELFDTYESSDAIKKFVAANPHKNTCLAAIARAKIGAATATGDIILDNVDARVKENYLKIDEATESACAPEDTTLGVINYASPLVLFYSDITDPKYQISHFNKYLLKHFMENGLFFVTVNFREDPLGIPAARNLTIDEMEKSTSLQLVSPKGIFYENSGVKSWRSFVVAHTSYYSARRIFSSAVVKTMVDGHDFLYDEEFQAKMLKKRKRAEASKMR